MINFFLVCDDDDGDEFDEKMNDVISYETVNNNGIIAISNHSIITEKIIHTQF